MGSTEGLHRRRVLRRAGALGAVPVAGCQRLVTEPAIHVPSSALVDEPLTIRVTGLTPYQSVTIRASTRARTGREWAAHARFDVSGQRTLSVRDQAPVAGTYTDRDPMGLFWSMRPTDVPPDVSLPPGVLFVPDPAGFQVTLVLTGDGERLAESSTTRRLFSPDIEQQPVADDVVGEFYAPPGSGPVPAVLHLHGVGGEPHRATGRLLASRGVATLALQYFGPPDQIPGTLTEVPLEYIDRAIRWLRRQDRVAGPDIGLFGFSRGGELALLIGSRSPDIGAIVGWVPSGLVWEGIGHERVPAGTSAWAAHGDPLPFLELADADSGPPPTPGLPYFEPVLSTASEAELSAAAIPVEECQAPILLISSTDDRRWPSTALSDRVTDRLAAAEYAFEYRHDSHRGAGHYIRFPYLPTTGTAMDARNVYGGTPAANARAAAAAWSETRSFLRQKLPAGSQ